MPCAALGIDAGGGLVEQQELGLVQHGGGQRELLFPAARQRAGELPLPRREAELLERAVDPFAASVEPMDSRRELEVFADGEVPVETEMLRHVAGLALDRFALAHQVVAEAAATAAIGRQQAADHAQCGRLARAVRTEEAADATLLDRQAQPVDHGAWAVALHQVVDVDRQAHGLASAMNSSTAMGRPGCSSSCVGSGRASIMKTSLARALCE